MSMHRLVFVGMYLCVLALNQAAHCLPVSHPPQRVIQSLSQLLILSVRGR